MCELILEYVTQFAKQIKYIVSKSIYDEAY